MTPAIRLKDHKAHPRGDLDDRVTETIHTLSSEQIMAREDVRQRIAFDLHDYVAQDLSAIKIGFQALYQQMNDSAENDSEAKRLIRLMDKTIASVRDLSHELRPPGLDETGLVDAVSSDCEEFAFKNGTEMHFRHQGTENLRLDPMTRINLYHVIHEALTNVKKHSKAKRVSVSIKADRQFIQICVADDGKGFEMSKRLSSFVREKRMGLRSMEGRIRLLNGTLNVESSPEKGTKITIKTRVKREGDTA